MAKNNLVLVVVLALVVAVIASVATVSLTGETVKVGGSTFYTKEEIDSNFYTKQTVNSLVNNINATSCSKDGVCEVQSLLKKTCANITSPLILNKAINLMAQEGQKVVVKEGEKIFYGEHVIIPNGLYKVKTITNSSYVSGAGGNDDYVELLNVIDSTTTFATIYSEGIGTISLMGLTYSLNYSASPSTLPNVNRSIILDYPQTSGTKKLDLSVCF